MARILSYLLTALIGGFVGAQLATPEAPQRVERTVQLPVTPRKSLSQPGAAKTADAPEPEVASRPRSEPKSPAKLAAEKAHETPTDADARHDYLELVRRHARWDFDDAGCRVEVTIDAFEGADRRLAQAIGNSELGRVRQKITLERVIDGKIRIRDPRRGQREGLRLWSDLEVEPDKLPAYLKPYLGYVPYATLPAR